MATLKKQPAAPPAPAPAAGAGPAAPPAAPAEPKFDKFLKGFYGTLDVSLDAVTKGMDGMVAHQYGQDPNNRNGFVIIGDKGGNCANLNAPSPPSRTPCGRLGYLPALGTNKSQIGYRGSHALGKSGTDFIWQVETSLGIVAAPGL